MKLLKPHITYNEDNNQWECHQTWGNEWRRWSFAGEGKSPMEALQDHLSSRNRWAYRVVAERNMKKARNAKAQEMGYRSYFDLLMQSAKRSGVNGTATGWSSHAKDEGNREIHMYEYIALTK